MTDDFVKWFELASHIVTVFGLPVAVVTLVRELRKERASEEKELEQQREELYQKLSDEYVQFLKLILQYPALRLLQTHPGVEFTTEQQEQRFVIFGILVSLLERAYILLNEPDMDAEGRRRWQSWDDYVREWCKRPDFRLALKDHIEGEDPAFRDYLLAMAAQAERGAQPEPGAQDGRSRVLASAPADSRIG